MSKILIQTEIDSQHFLTSFSKMKVQDLEYFARALNKLIAQKKAKAQKEEEAALLQAVNEAVLSSEKMETYLALRKKMQAETITETEHQQFKVLVEEEENLRNKRLELMIELSKVREITLPQLMKELGLKPL